MTPNYSFVIHGTRGSFPAADRQFVKFGGRTTCFSLRTPKSLLVFDAGTGILDLDATAKPLPTTILFTHLHLDHVMGLPGFPALYQPGRRVTLMADGRRCPDWQTSLRRLAAPPFWPLEIDRFGARLAWKNLPRTGRMRIGEVRLTWLPVRHPQSCLAYRIEAPRRTIIIATDYEPGDTAADQCFIDFCSGADVLIFDAQFTPREYPDYRGWGHGTWRQGVDLARAAGVKSLLLTHHAPTRSDRRIAAIEQAAKRVFPAARAAFDGLTLRWHA